MKYLFTITSKAFVLCLLLLSITAEIKAQKNTDSPYSRYGIGLLNQARFNGNFGLGGVGYAWRPYHYKPQVYDSLARSNAKLNDRGSNFINPANPASFSNISLTTFEASMVSRNTEYTSGAQSRTGSNTQFGHMAVAFPVGENWGVGFGIRPFSSVGYDYSLSSSINGVGVTNQYEGSGGVNEIFFGTAAQINKNFSVGVSGKYLFGNIVDDRRIVYGDGAINFFNTYDQRDIRVNNFSLDFGAQYFKSLNNESRIIVGLKVSPGDELNANQSQLIRNYEGINGLERFKDTSLFIDDENTSIPFAPTYGIGIAYEIKKKWIVAADYTQLAWDSKLEQGVLFENNSRFNFGFERYTNPSAFGSYFKKMGYRLGASYNSSLLVVEGEDISEFGISFGISMPLRKSFSTLNFGVEFGQRGKDENGLTQEEFFNFQFGVTINDKWFIKRKYD